MADSDNISEKSVLQMLQSNSPVDREQGLDFAISTNMVIPFEKIRSLIEDENTFVREKALKTLPRYGNDIAWDYCLKTLSDTDELMRITASEVLFHVQLNHKNITMLINCFHNSAEPLVERNIAEILGMTKTSQSIKALKKKLTETSSDQVRLGIYCGMIAAGIDDYFFHLLNLLDSEDYQVQCAVANALSPSMKHRNEIITKLNNRLKIEKTIAVKSALLSAVSSIGKD